ncbi:MAG: hypothetical protein R2706_00815 [Acidimicrobiales bacterium]
MGELVNLQASDVDGVAIIRLDRPKVSTLNSQVGEELLAVVEEIRARDDVRAVVVWGGSGSLPPAPMLQRSQSTPTTGILPLSLAVLNDANFALENLPR